MLLAFGATLVLAVIAFATFQPIKVLPRIRLAPGFVLVDQHGDTFTSEDLRGSVTLYTFTYGGCEAPCFDGDYVAHFSDRFLGLGGDPADIERVASLYGVYHAKADEAAPGQYTVDHTATLLAVGPDGYLRVMFPNGVTTDELAADLDFLLG